jgi:hypothetical protein
MFGKIKDFFVGLGHLLAKALHLVHDLVPEEQLARGVELAKEAADKFIDNADRRAYVIEKLVAQFGIPESIARLIVELAVRLLKKEAADLIDKGVAAGTEAPAA